MDSVHKFDEMNGNCDSKRSILSAQTEEMKSWTEKEKVQGSKLPLRYEIQVYPANSQQNINIVDMGQLLALFYVIKIFIYI